MSSGSTTLDLYLGVPSPYALLYLRRPQSGAPTTGVFASMHLPCFKVPIALPLPPIMRVRRFVPFIAAALIGGATLLPLAASADTGQVSVHGTGNSHSQPVSLSGNYEVDWYCGSDMNIYQFVLFGVGTLEGETMLVSQNQGGLMSGASGQTYAYNEQGTYYVAAACDSGPWALTFNPIS
jgi:hypothetical protein